MRANVYEALINADRVKTATATFHCIDALQRFHEDRGVQTNAAAILFILLCERFQLNQQDVFTVAKNLLNTHDDRLGTEFEAIRMYLREEL
ncbi:hypothetical protein [Martelella mangrovi]|uniref:Uncharacterized protein n=1 Tax=Martelella mangrovi TaxID=1397477 RepID=A0ABV2IE01_9HYPH